MDFCVFDNLIGQIQTKLEIKRCSNCGELPAVKIHHSERDELWLCGDCISRWWRPLEQGNKP